MSSLSKSMKDSYQLALKSFMSKNFVKSFAIIQPLKDQAIQEFAQFNLDQALLIQITSLYLVEVGVFLSAEVPVLSAEDRNWLVSFLKANKFITQLAEAYGEGNDIPSEVWYNYHLVFMRNRELLLASNEVNYLKDLNKLYTRLPETLDSDDPFRKKLLDLYVFEILPTFNEFQKAESILQTNDLFKEDYETYKIKLDSIQKEKKEQEKVEKERAKEQEKKLREQKAREVKKEKEAEKQKNLKYRSVRDIARQISNDSGSEHRDNSPSSSARGTQSSSQLQLLRTRSVYLYNISKQYLKTNYPILAILILVLVAGTKYISVKKIKVRENLLETIKMAFKISYL